MAKTPNLTPLQQHQAYIARAKDLGARTLTYSTPCCGKELEDRVPDPGERQWDTLCSCAHCGAMFMKIATSDRIVGRIPEGAPAA